MPESDRWFVLEITGGDMFTAADIWPDGDAPDNPTAADVIEVIRKYGPLTSWLRAWSMDETIEVTVDGERVRF